MSPESIPTYNERYANDPNTVNFDDTLVDRYSTEGENSFVCDYPCILKRVSLPTISGSPLIQLADDVQSIRRVTWQGFKCDPLPHRNFREVFQNATQIGRPFWYVFNNVGTNVIQLFPAPNASLSAAPSNASLYSADTIGNYFIVEYFQVPTPNPVITINSNPAILPLYFRRRLLKAYIMRALFNKEGQGQNLKVSKYFKDRWNFLSAKYGELLADLYNKPRKLVVNGITASSYFPGQPVLPIDRFGISVDQGE